MRFRRTAAVAAALLVAGGLAGCQTNVGTAAWINGHRVTESDINAYLTPAAKPITVSSSSGQTRDVAPRSVVLSELIDQQLFFRVLKSISPGLTFEKLDAAVPATLGQQAVDSLRSQVIAKGYTAALVQVVLRVQALSSLFGRAEQNHVDVSKILRTIDFPVSVNPRYGKWDARTKTLDDRAVVPGYLTPKVGSVTGQ